MVCRTGISLAPPARPFFWVLPCLLAMAGPVAAQDCGAIAAATVLELKAGAGDGWRTEDEALARRAAGAACVKARSGRYATPQSDAEKTGEIDLSVTEGAQGASERSTTTAEAASAAATAEPEGDDSLWPFGKFKINDVSASPSKKPYERRRLVKDK